MDKILKLEEALLFLACTAGLYFLEAPWWCYPVLILGPDISMLLYLAGPKPGAIAYNIFHHKGIGATILMTGLLTGEHVLQLTGLVVIGHSSMDRLFGYGLKYEHGFQFTHLGKIGKNKLK